MSDYYSRNLSAERLELCYKLAPPRIIRYLNAEIDFVKEKLNAEDFVLELGCGYGRVLKRIQPGRKHLFGIDNASNTLFYGRSSYIHSGSCFLSTMDAFSLGFKSGVFDTVFCIQNGISAFGKDPELLIKEAVRVTKNGGRILFSSYSDKVWNHRLQWFKIQADNHLIGEIDYNLTGNGTIVCKDGFRATTFNIEQFRMLTDKITGSVFFYEIDNSSIFCEIIMD